MDKLVCLIVSTVVMVGAHAAMFFRLSELRYDHRKVQILTAVLGAVMCAVSTSPLPLPITATGTPSNLC